MSIEINSFGHVKFSSEYYNQLKKANPQGLATLSKAETVYANAGLEACIEEMLAGCDTARAAFTNAVASYRPHAFRVALQELALLTAAHRREAVQALAAVRGSDFSDFFRVRGSHDVANIVRRSDGWTTGHRPGDTALVSVARIVLVLGWPTPAAKPTAAPAAPTAAPAVEPVAAPAAEPTAAPAAEPKAAPAAKPKPRRKRNS